jgi:hypothetical protein
VSDPGKSVVLGAEGDVQRARARAREERGRQIADAALDVEARVGENVTEPPRALLFLETQLRRGVEAMAERDQPLAWRS